jgi:metal-responsive CopG/Arc/MetJ family transcriptional regulator
MRKIKISIYLDPIQVKMMNKISKELKQKRSLLFREAINLYISYYLKSKEKQN